MGCSSSSSPLAEPARPQSKSLSAVEPASPKRESGSCGDDRAASIDKTLLFVAETTPKGPVQHNEDDCIEAEKFYINLSGIWVEFETVEDRLLKRGYLIGHEHVQFTLRGATYQTHYQSSKHTNANTKKERDIRIPTAPMRPQVPLLPSGPLLIRTVAEGQQGTVITVSDVLNEGEDISVFVPPGAKVGDKIAVPIPAKGESAKDLQSRQKTHYEKIYGSKVAGHSAFGGEDVVGVESVILGSHLQDQNSFVEADNRSRYISKWLGDLHEDAEDFVLEVF